MKIAITDANIFIDLIKLRILQHLFAVELEIYTTIEILNELKSGQRSLVDEFIHVGKLRLYSFSAEEWSEILQMKTPRSLTKEDSTIVYLAKKLEVMVLSGDNPLRKFCSNNSLEVKGILWLFDQFLLFNLINKNEAVLLLTNLLSFNNRLPLPDCEHRLKEWKKSL